MLVKTIGGGSRCEEEWGHSMERRDLWFRVWIQGVRKHGMVWELDSFI